MRAIPTIPCMMNMHSVKFMLLVLVSSHVLQPATLYQESGLWHTIEVNCHLYCKGETFSVCCHLFMLELLGLPAWKYSCQSALQQGLVSLAFKVSRSHHRPVSSTARLGVIGLQSLKKPPSSSQLYSKAWCHWPSKSQETTIVQSALQQGLVSLAFKVSRSHHRPVSSTAWLGVIGLQSLRSHHRPVSSTARLGVIGLQSLRSHPPSSKSGICKGWTFYLRLFLLTHVSWLPILTSNTNYSHMCLDYRYWLATLITHMCLDYRYWLATLITHTCVLTTDID